MRGPWWAAAAESGHVTVVAGLRGALPDVEILHAAGVAVDGGDASGLGAAVEFCGRVRGRDPVRRRGGGDERRGRQPRDLGLPGKQREFAEAVLERAHRHGEPVIVVLFSGRPLVVPWLMESADAVLAAWFPGSEAGNAIADLVPGRVSPGRTTAGDLAAGAGPDTDVLRPAQRRPPARSRRITTPASISTSPNEPLFPFGHGLTYGRFTLYESAA